MHLVIVTPAKPGTRHGNRNTAMRWAVHLRALGHKVDVEVEWRSGDQDVMIALHARRSRAAMLAWKQVHPHRPLVLALTGTDLYRDIRSDAGALASLDLADHLLVLQEKGLDELNATHRAKARVIYQSVRAYRRQAPPRSYFLVSVLGHLRDEKDPFCAARALAFLDPAYRVRVVHLGKAMEPAYAREARARMHDEPRYRWLGELDHPGAMRWLTRSHVMVISSRMEGGAHVVSEAIGAGVPVIASRIPGNVGLLGDDYPAYFPEGNDCALAALLARAQERPAFYASLVAAVRARRNLVEPSLEREALRRLLGDLHFADS